MSTLIKEEIDKIISDKFYNLMALLEYIEFDPETKTITIKGDIKFKIEGNYELEADKHLVLKSGQTYDKEKDMEYSILLNCDK